MQVLGWHSKMGGIPLRAALIQIVILIWVSYIQANSVALILFLAASYCFIPEIMWEKHARGEMVYRKRWSSQVRLTLSTAEPYETGREQSWSLLVAARLCSSLNLRVIFLPLYPGLLSRSVVGYANIFLILLYTSDRIILNS